MVGGSARTEVLDEGTDNMLVHVTELVTGGAARALGAARAPGAARAGGALRALRVGMAPAQPRKF